MKNTIYLLLTIAVLAAPALLKSQSVVQIDNGATLEVQSGADICADQRVINGSLTGGGTWCLVPLMPNAPQLSSPPYNATGQLLTLNLIWHKSFGAVSYRVQLSTDSLFSSLIINDSTVTDSIKTVSGLSPLTYYWWRVNAKGIGGTSAYSVVYKFKTLGYPNQVALINPPNNAVNQSTSIQFRWNRASEQMMPLVNSKETIGPHNDIDAISNYWFELVTDTVSMSNLLGDTTLTDTTKSVSGLSNSTNYYWHVKAKNQIGWGVFSSWWRFTTIVAAPIAPVLISPPNNATGQPLSLSLVWHASAYATTYHVQLSTNSGFTSFIVNDSTITDTVRAVSGLSQTTTYYWRVSAKNIGGTSGYSPVWSFTTMSLVPNLTLKVYLEGFYSPEPMDIKTKGNVTKGLNDEPLAQVEDTVRILLADSLQNYAFVDSVKVYLPTSGTITTPFTGITTGKYYIVVKHRNHLETWSKYAVDFTGGGTTTYDFTIAASQAYGDNMKQVGSVWVLYGGDPNQDGEIGALDIPIFIAQFGTQGYLSCDFNGDGDVTGVDQQILIQNYGLTIARPSTVTLNPENRKKMNKFLKILKEFNSNK
jgi:hypothetical protein